MKRTHQKKIGELYDQLQALIQEIEAEPTYLIDYPDHTNGPAIKVVKVDMALVTALDQLGIAAEFAR
jgi:hypothetical protein